VADSLFFYAGVLRNQASSASVDISADPASQVQRLPPRGERPNVRRPDRRLRRPRKAGVKCLLIRSAMVRNERLPLMR
jgi:hypothetical protein